MNNSGLAASLLASALLTAAAATPAHAAAPTKMWVAKSGADSASCGATTAPCRTFQQAHDNVAAGGAIGVLTPGDYGVVFVSKSVNITNDGAGEAATPIGFGNVNVRAGPGDVVGLRGLLFDGAGSGSGGIEFDSGSALHIQSCVVRNFTGTTGAAVGIYFVPSTKAKLFVSDSIIHNNGSGGGGFTGGIIVRPGNHADVDIVLNRVRLENNVIGLHVDTFSTTGDVHVAIRNSVVSGSSGNAMETMADPSPTSRIIAFVRNSAVIGNAGVGISSFGSSIVAVSAATVARNGAGLSATNGGQIISYRNNEIDNNTGPDGTPTGFFAPR